MHMKEEAKHLFYINSAVLSIEDYIYTRKETGFDKEKFKDLCNDLKLTFLLWTGETYVGERKSEELTNGYQNLFTKICSLIQFLQESDFLLDDFENDFLKSIVYQGLAYRYLGYISPGNKKHILPEYNDIYVSWSKNKYNPRIENKLYYPVTWMACNINEPRFGIDIERFNVFYNNLFNTDVLICRDGEREVVFPTTKNCIFEVKYINDDGEEKL